MTKEKYVDSVINTHDYPISIHKLADSELDHLSSLFWEEDCRDTYMLSESKRVSDCIMHLLQEGDSDSKLDLIDAIKHTIVDTYYLKMEQLIDERVSYLKQDEMERHGFYPRIDNENGELHWGGL